ncbi:MAG: folate-binding protein [Actinomyces sp.]|uniref:CAF17-like 4Fe-4S cluster assembly/insertion protein YgfZ n=1 Tax=Actinomyces sp. TaxID=29317 RepID=UPI0026DBDBCC|nr:folate-binding protein [Actinomyces sp.]MDO4244312.1 folate-binding protein [Actinomyces sp.]
MERSPLFARPGAVENPADDPDALVPAHFGDPPREQVLLAAGRAVSALARDVVEVSGPDRLTWLTTLSSQVLTSLAPDDGGAETLLLDSRGRITHALAALDDGRRLLLVTEAGSGPALAEFLDSMRFMLRVEVGLRADVAVLGAMGPGVARLAQAARQVPPDPEGAPVGHAEAAGAPAEAAGALLGVWRDPWPGVVEGGTSYDVGLTRPHPGASYSAGWVLVPAAAVDGVVGEFLAAASARHDVAGSLAWEALRVEAGRPRWAREVDERAIPHELDWLRTAVHLTKGCYPGQETVARTLNLGRPPRRLTVLQLDGLTGRSPLPGAAVRKGEAVVGAVTSVVRHHDYGPLALALLRRAVPLDEPLTVEVVEADDDGQDAGAEGGALADASGGPRAERVDASQEPLVSPEGRAQASPDQRPGAGLRPGLLR